MVPDLPVLRMAYLIEQDFVEFYEQAAQKTDGEVRQVLETLAAWERRHAAFSSSCMIRLLMNMQTCPGEAERA